MNPRRTQRKLVEMCVGGGSSKKNSIMLQRNQQVNIYSYDANPKQKVKQVLASLC